MASSRRRSSIVKSGQTIVAWHNRQIRTVLKVLNGVCSIDGLVCSYEHQWGRGLEKRHRLALVQPRCETAQPRVWHRLRDAGQSFVKQTSCSTREHQSMGCVTAMLSRAWKRETGPGFCPVISRLRLCRRPVPAFCSQTLAGWKAWSLLIGYPPPAGVGAAKTFRPAREALEF